MARTEAGWSGSTARPDRSGGRLPGLVALAALPISLLAVTAGSSHRWVDATRGLETQLLGLVASAALAALAGLAWHTDRDRRREPGAVTVAVATLGSAFTLLAIPAWEVRAATLVALLGCAFGVLAWGIVGRWGRGQAEEVSFPPCFAAAVFLQTLLRSDRFFESWSWSFALEELVLWPAVAAAAVALLARRVRGPVVLAALLATVLARGVGPEAAIGLAVLALAAGWRTPPHADARARWALAGTSILVAARSVLPALAGAGGSLGTASATGWIGLVAVPAIVGRLLGDTGRARSSSWLPGAVLLIAAALLLGHRDGIAVTGALAGILALALPASLLGAIASLPTRSGPGERARRALAGTGLVLASAPLIPAEPALLAGFLALASAPGLSSSAVRMQAVWATALIGVAGLAAGLPWLNPQPLEAALGVFGLTFGWKAISAVAATLAALVLAEHSMRRTSLGSRPGWAPALAPGLAAVAILAAALTPSILRPTEPLLTDAIVLGSDEPEHEILLDVGARGSLAVVDAYLGGEPLAVGTPALAITFFAGNAQIERMTLDAGIDIANWAADRPSAGQGVAPAPAASAGLNLVPDGVARRSFIRQARRAAVPWIARPAPDGPYFARRYRSRHPVALELPADRVRLEVTDEARGSVEVALFYLGVR